MKLRNHRGNKIRLLEQVSAIVAFFCNALRAPAINVDCISMFLDKFSCRKQVFRVVRAELDNQGSVLLAGHKHILPILFLCCKEPCVKHWGIAKLRTIPPSKHSVGQVRLVHHRRHYVFGRANAFEPIVAM